jgi:hypothetical protein
MLAAADLMPAPHDATTSNDSSEQRERREDEAKKNSRDGKPVWWGDPALLHARRCREAHTGSSGHGITLAPRSDLDGRSLFDKHPGSPGGVMRRMQPAPAHHSTPPHAPLRSRAHAPAGGARAGARGIRARAACGAREALGSAALATMRHRRASSRQCAAAALLCAALAAAACTLAAGFSTYPGSCDGCVRSACGARGAARRGLAVDEAAKSAHARGTALRVSTPCCPLAERR